MTRRARLALVLVLLLTLPCLAQAETPVAAEAPPAETPKFHTLQLGDQASPPATLKDIAWMAGRWVGEGMGGYNEEIWSEPKGGAMMGTFRHIQADKPVFYEFLLFLEEKGSLILKLKHFNPDLTGWEERNDFVDFPLVKVEPNAAHFDGLSYLHEPDGSLIIYLRLRGKNDKVWEEKFVLRRPG